MMSNFDPHFIFLVGSVGMILMPGKLQYAKIGSDLKALNSTSWIATA